MAEADSELIQTADEATFEARVTQAGGAVLAIFSAEWCAYCKALKPTLKNIAQDYQGRLTLVEIDADASPNLVERFNVASLPALFFFKDGVEVDSVTTVIAKGKLIAKIESFMAS